MGIVIASLILGAIIALATFFSKPKRRGKQLPGPTGLPILGCAAALTPDTILPQLEEYRQKYGSTYEMTALGTRFIVTSEIDMIRETLAKRPRAFRRPDSLETCSKVLGISNGLFQAEGDNWGRIRRLTAPAFSHGQIDALMHTINTAAKSWLDKIKSMAEPDGSLTTEGMTLFESFTTNVIVRAAFGENFFTPYLGSKQFFEDTNTVLIYLRDRVLWPLPEWTWNLLPLPIKIRVRLADHRFTRVCKELITKARESYAQGDDNETEGSFVKSLIRAHDGESTRSSLDDVELIAQIKTFLIAGAETTSTALTWTLKELMEHPYLLDRIREETAAYLGSSNGKWPTSVEALNHFKWSDATMREVIRLHAPAPMLFLQAVAPIELKDEIWADPADIIVLMSETSLMSPEYFSEPLAFKPERWLVEEKRTMLDILSLGFGGGPRICPGMRLAYAEATVALAMLLHHYDIELLCDPQSVRRVSYFVVGPSHMPVKLIPRKA